MMVEFLQTKDFEDALKAVGAFSTHQSFPIPNRRVSLNEYIKGTWNGLMNREIFEQLHSPEGDVHGVVRSFYFTLTPLSGGTFCRSMVMWGTLKELRAKYEYDPDTLIVEESATYGRAFQFWKVGCDHKHYTERSIGHCYSEFTCQDCGHVWRIDMS